ncbi:RusA family crossover junction endodeoxyribonuclease [Curtobacterium sp. MCSS17_006]|uniref:RusA family crossover junction endodeoxyribonuclease n=1 Tax=Curtobacterium sp. MCSS17_006 TaxID=2175642 RepID=UPI0015E8E0B4|nr:RusA family crossover junction endodeoxyribonuclease [Curtobacterium sp. MCSS17_006]
MFDNSGTYRILKLTIPGQPIPKGRPRFGRGRTFTDQRTLSAEAGIAAEFHRTLGVRHTIETPVTGKLNVRLRFFRNDNRRVDCDNLAKVPLDALNGLAWADDSQIVSLIISKHHDADNPRTEIDVFTAAGA